MLQDKKPRMYITSIFMVHSCETIARRVEGLWKDNKKGRRFKKELVTEKDSRFGMTTSDPTVVKFVSRSGEVKMSEMEYIP